MRILPIVFAGAAGLSILATSLPARADWDDHGDRHRRHADRDDSRGHRGDRDDWRGHRGDRDDWRRRGDRDDWRGHGWGWNGGSRGYYGAPYGYGFGGPGFSVFVR